MRYTTRYRSFFWPAILILAGVLALLVNAGWVPVDRLYLLLYLWPVILIVIGLEIIVRRAVHGLAGDVAAALIVLVAMAGALVYVVASPNPTATHTLEASAPVGSVSQAAVEIDVGAATINVSGSTEVGSDLYRAHIDYSGRQPDVTFDQSTGKLKISQENSGFSFESRKFALTLNLNPGVPWTVIENSGATSDTLDLSNLHVGSLTLNTGASRDDITLGPLSGTVPVEINGGALTVHVRRPAGVPTSIAVSGGAVTLNADGRAMHAIGNLSYVSGDFGGAADRYQISINGGACTVTLDTTAALA